MKIPKPKLPQTRAGIAGLIVGVIIGGAAITNAATGGQLVGIVADTPAEETQTTAQEATSQASGQETATDTSDPESTNTGQGEGSSAPTGGGNTTTTPSNTTSGVGQNSPSGGSDSPSPASTTVPVPVTLTGVVKSYQPSARTGFEDVICTYNYSDGTSKTKLGGRRPLDTLNGQVSYDIDCSPTY